jgi:protein-S-isoprenylcysteine O-methyltransferase Ste14
MTAAASKIIWLVFIVVYFTLRVGPQWHSRRTPVRRSARTIREAFLMVGTISGLGILPGIYVFTGFPHFADYTFVPAQGYLGAALCISVLWLLYRTHRDLGRNWSVSLDVREEHTLVTTGVYARVRHPMYTAFWLMGLAQLLLLPNWIAGPAGLVAFAVLFFGRVGREEQMMIDTFGDEYRSYMRRTARLIPWVY